MTLVIEGAALLVLCTMIISSRMLGSHRQHVDHVEMAGAAEADTFVEELRNGPSLQTLNRQARQAVDQQYRGISDLFDAWGWEKLPSFSGKDR